MGLKDINYKQFLFDRGEQIGLGVAITLMVLLLLPLFLPGSGFLAPSAAANANALNDQSKTIEGALDPRGPNQPTDADKPGDTKDKLTAFSFIPISAAKAKDYEVAGLFDPHTSGTGGGRRMPELKSIKESDLALVRFQLPSLIYDTKFETVLTLEGATGTNGPMGTTPSASSSSSPMPNNGSFTVPGALGTHAGMQWQKHGITVDKNGAATDKMDRDYNTKFVKIKDLTSAMKPAEQPLPVRAAEIVAAFPYKQQIQEFRDKLGLPTDGSVLAEPSLETDEYKRPLAAFRFKGVKVQRRVLNAAGQPVDARGQPVAEKNGGWADIDLGDAYKPLIVLGGGVDRLQPEDPKFQPIVFPGLVMRKLPTFGAMRTPPVDEFPDLEDGLTSIKDTVAALTTVPNAQVARPSFTQVQGSIFDLNPAAGQQNGPFATTPGGYMPAAGSSSAPPPPRPSNSMEPMSGLGPMGTTNAQLAVPDVCLIRLFDFTVDPGKTYEYRLQVQMANPNYGRKDAASQGYAADPDLPAPNWYVVPKKLVVPQDLYYYAVDQKDLDAKAPQDRDKDKDKEKDPKLPTPPVKEGQTTLQIQKWVDYLHPKSRGADVAIGDWVIAERVIATRGEPVARQRVEAPYWRYAQDKFTMYSDQPPPKPEAAKRFVASVEMPFTPDGEEPVLVDYTGGETTTYVRTRPPAADAAPDAKPAVQPPIQEKGPEEALLYTADGKLLAHNAAHDAADADRVKRLEDVRKWIEDVKKMKGGKDDKLFGPGT